MKPITLITLFLAILILPIFANDDEDKKAKTKIANFKVKQIMEMMNLPQYGLYKLSSEDKYDSKGFKQASEEVIKYGKKMKDIKHPEKKFQVFNDDMLKALDTFEKSLKSGDKDKLKKSWLVLKVKCADCHTAYIPHKKIDK